MLFLTCKPAGYISDLMTWDSLASSTLMRSWPRCALCNDDVLQAKLFPTKYHPVCIEGRHSVLETDLWRKGLLTRPGHQGELVAVSMVKLKRSSSSKKLAASVLLEMEFLILKTFSFQHKQANSFILPLPSLLLPSDDNIQIQPLCLL